MKIEDIKIGESYNCKFTVRVPIDYVSEGIPVVRGENLSGNMVYTGEGDIDVVDYDNGLVQVLEKATRKPFIVYFDKITDIKEGSICAEYVDPDDFLSAEDFYDNHMDKML
jgi:hypothetical protein